MKIGPTVRLIRQRKGFTQKEVYGDIVTRSFAQRFEKGANDISSAKLFMILNNLSITANEFEFVANEYQLPVLNQYLITVFNLYNKRAFTELSQWIQKQKNANPLSDKLKMAIGYAEIILMAYSYIHIPWDVFIQSFWTSICQNKQWTLQEIELAPLLIPIIDNKNELSISIEQLTEKMEFGCEPYIKSGNDYFNATESLITFYGTLLQKYLNDREFDRARQLINKFNSIDDKRLHLEESVDLTFWKLIWGLYFDDYDKNKHQLEIIMATMKIIPNHQATLQDVYRVRVKNAKAYQRQQSQ